MFRLSIMLQCVAVPRESFSTELGSSTGDVAACETEPEIGCEVTGCAVRESAGGGVGGERVGELLEEEDVFTGTEVKGEGLDVGLTGHGLCGQHGADNFRQLSQSIFKCQFKGAGGIRFLDLGGWKFGIGDSVRWCGNRISQTRVLQP